MSATRPPLPSRPANTDSPVLLLPCGAARSAVQQVDEFIRERFGVQSATWSLTDHPTLAQLTYEKRFILIIAGAETGEREKSSEKTSRVSRLERLCRIIGDTPNVAALVLSEREVRTKLPVKTVTMAFDLAWKQQVADELLEAKAVVDPSVLRERLALLIDQLSFNLLEREEAVRLCVLTTLARESIFLLGPPGVAKSLIARRIKELFPREARAFEYLMNRFSTPDEIFGPVSIAGLKVDRLQRKTESYLPSADVVFLDEIWKAGPSIQNALLTAINEKIFRNDGVDQPIPLKALISASNELPAEDEGLDALWDRFLVRLQVGNIEVPEHRHQMIRAGSQMQVAVPDDQRFTNTELASLDHQIDNVAIPDRVLSVLDGLIPRIEKFNHQRSEQLRHESTDDKGETQDKDKKFRSMYVSDRRWKKIGRLLRACALCNGRHVVNELDCYLISYCIWNDQDQVHEARQMVIAAIENSLSFAELNEQWQRLQEQAAGLPGTQYVAPTPFGDHYKIDLSTNGDLLSDADFGEFRRLPKKYYEKLTESFQPILLRGQGADQAKVLAKIGASPAQIILTKSDNTRPLKPFSAADFELTHTSKAAKQTRADRSSEQARRFLAELNVFRKTLKALQGAPEDFLDARTHVFVDLPPDVLDRFSTARQKANQKLNGLLKEIAKFAKEKGLD